jgi:hypothetical protein
VFRIYTTGGYDYIRRAAHSTSLKRGEDGVGSTEFQFCGDRSQTISDHFAMVGRQSVVSHSWPQK